MSQRFSRNRARISWAIDASPGIHLRALQRLLGVSFTTLRYHVTILAKAGNIERTQQGSYIRLYPKGFPSPAMPAASALRFGTSSKVMHEIVLGKNKSNKSISRSTGLAESTVSTHLQILLKLGIIRRATSPEGRREYVPTRNPMASLIQFSGSKLQVASERYIQLWDF